MSQYVGQNVDGTWSNAFQTVTCPDGTKDFAIGIAPPCMGIKYGNQKPIVGKRFYKFKDDFINGVLPNGKPNIIFKKGDIIQNDGIVTEKFVFNTMTKGIMSKPTVVGARVEEAGGLVFVPISRVDLVDSQENAKKQYEDALKNEQEKAQSQAQSQGNNTKEPIYYILVTAGVLVAGFFAYKKFKK